MILQLVKFGIVGVIAALVDVGVLTLIVELLDANVLIASAISFCVSVAVNYILSMSFVFRSKKKSRIKEFALFVILSIGGLCLNQFVMWIGENYTQFHYLAVKIFAMVIVPVYNFITRKLFLEAKDER